MSRGNVSDEKISHFDHAHINSVWTGDATWSVNIELSNDLPAVQLQAITWANVDLLLTGPSGNLIKMQ